MFSNKILLFGIALFSIYNLKGQEKVYRNFKHISKLVEIRKNIPSRINESSGLIFFKKKLWTHNDCGDGPYIYALDTTGKKIEQILTLANARNIDWEEITQDDQYIYIGDIGNNYGLRNTMVIYRIDKQFVPDSGNITVIADSIVFHYKNMVPDQPGKHKFSDFDCEAMIALNDTLILFSKNWNSPRCNIYFLPAKPGEYEIVPQQTLAPDGLITAASLSPDKKKLLLLGYKDYCPFLYLINHFNLYNITLNKSVHRYFSARLGLQTEGITFFNDHSAFISCESNSLRANSLFKVFLK
jgi:hypothetical protein